ncbi:MAG: GNAT family N-acetyltransferase [Oscillospiraceae bacterium]|jgi:ribosomal protein S18 acetylase RimI-like enzyme|nr:GNAT family N-acetyltransferase [Oscillospiraceae bacterium]
MFQIVYEGEFAMTVYNAELKDFDAIFSLLEQLWPGRKLDKNAQEGVYRTMLSAKGEYSLCARAGGDIAGFCAFSLMNSYFHEGPIFYISILVVDEKHRRQGIGKALIDHVRDFAAQEGIKAIELDSAFHRKGAHAFYESLGFEKDCYRFVAAL